MKKRNVLLGLTGIIGAGAALLALPFLFNKEESEEDKELREFSEKKFHGVPLSELDELAELIDYRDFCIIDEEADRLVFNYVSDEDDTVLQARFFVDDEGDLDVQDSELSDPVVEFLDMVNENIYFD